MTPASPRLRRASIAGEAATELASARYTNDEHFTILATNIILAAIEEAIMAMLKEYDGKCLICGSAQPQHEPVCTCLQDFGCDTECPVHGSSEQSPSFAKAARKVESADHIQAP